MRWRGGGGGGGGGGGIYARLDGHDRDLDRMLAWQNRADGAMVLARWALGASLVSLVAVAHAGPGRVGSGASTGSGSVASNARSPSDPRAL